MSKLRFIKVILRVFGCLKSLNISVEKMKERKRLFYILIVRFE